MRVAIELNTTSEVEKFTKAVQHVDVDVRVIGKDENGNHWEMSAKSLFCSLMLAAKVQNRAHTAHDVDWNTIWCECDKDIYQLIREFVKE
jgi:hypothetical protein